MGLDVYFFRKPIHRKIEKCFNDIISDLLKTDNNELKSAIEDIYTYTVENHISFEEWLNENVRSTLMRFSVPSSTDLGEEVAYFRKLWWIVNYFEYKDDDYDKNVEITKSQIEDLVSMSKKLILMVEKHFTDKGLEIEHSPLEYFGNTSRYGGSRCDYLTFKNSLFTDEMIEEADEICSSALDSNDSFLFYKVCEIFIQFSKILETTDFDKEKIYINADW